MKKRILSIILATSILFTLIPAMLTPKVKAAATINIGEYVQMGRYYDESILWRCVDIDENGLLMLSDRILTIKPFDANGTHYYMDGTLQPDNYDYRKNHGSNLWETSNMRSWLNSTATAGNVKWLDGCPPTNDAVYNGYNDYATEKGFMADGNFTTSERNAIKSVTQKSILNGIDANKLKVGGTTTHTYNYNINSVVQNYDTAYYQNVTNKMFLLDVKQISRVYQNSSLLGTNYYIGKPTQNAVDNSEYKTTSLSANNYWDNVISTPRAESGGLNSLRFVGTSGSVGYTRGNYNLLGARPAFYLNLSSVIFKSGNGTSGLPFMVAGGSDRITSNPTTTIPKPTGAIKATPTPKPTDALKTSRLLIGKDNNSFRHSEVGSYFLSNGLYEQLTFGQKKAVKEEILQLIDSKWGGSCFGIAASQGLVKLGKIQAAQIQTGKTQYDDFTMDARVRSFINYYHLSQKIPVIRSARTTVSRLEWYNLIGKNSLTDVFKTIIQKSKMIETGSAPFMFLFFWGDSGHAVIANGYNLMPNGEHRIEIVDSNKLDGYAYAYIKKDFSSWRYEGVAYDGLSENTWKMIGYSEFDSFNKISNITEHPDYSKKNQSETQSSDSVFVSIINPLMFSILNSLNQKLEYKENAMSGSLKPKSLDFTVGADADNPLGGSIVFELEKSESYSFIPKNDSISFSVRGEDEYSYISTTGSKLIEVAPGSKISIDGSDVTYEMYVSNTTDEVGLIKIADEDTGNIKVEHTDDGIILSADSLKDVMISNILPGGKTATEINTEKKQVLIAEEGAAGKKALNVYVSKNEDGVFDTAIKGSSSAETSTNEQSEGDTSENKTNRNNFIILIGLGVLILIAVTVIIIVKKKKSKKPV